MVLELGHGRLFFLKKTINNIMIGQKKTNMNYTTMEMKWSSYNTADLAYFVDCKADTT